MSEVVQFPADKLVSPSLFQVKYTVGTRVYFPLKGYLIEGIVEGYFGHITPDTNLTKLGVDTVEGGAVTAQVSQVGYAVTYYVPNPQPTCRQDTYVKQSQLLDESEIFSSKDDLIDWFLNNNYLKLPKDVDPSNFRDMYPRIIPV